MALKLIKLSVKSSSKKEEVRIGACEWKVLA